MFDSLKKKLSGWLGKKEEKVSEKPKKKKKVEKEKSKEKTVSVKSRSEETGDDAKAGAMGGTGREEKKVGKKVKKKEAEKLVGEAVEKKIEEKVEKIEKKVDERVEDISEVVKDDVEEKLWEETPKSVLEEEMDEEENTGFFFKLKKKLLSSVLTQAQFDKLFDEMELVLLENNVALAVVDKIKESLGKDLVGVSIKKGEVESTISESLKNSISIVLVEPDDFIKNIEKSLEPFVILFFGINGSGKTTSVAKLAYKLEKSGLSCVLAAGDTFRAASIEQLETHGRKIGVPVVKSGYGKDPASVAFDAIAFAKKNKKRVVLIDTAGRMYTKANLMKEMEKIVKISKPDLKIFVGESITGNDATEQAKMFNETAGIDGIILSKADVDEKAGAILSVSHVTGKPIYFLGTGQEYEDLKVFSKGEVLKGLGLED